MPIVIPTDDWSAPVTLTARTIFQCRAGSVLLHTDGAASPGEEDGLLMRHDPMRPLYDTIVLEAGVSVRWRRQTPRPTTLYRGTLE